MAITFSFKDKRKIELEKYNFPVLTQRAYEGKKKEVAKFALNKAALKALGYSEDLKGSKVSIGRDDEKDVLILVNTTGTKTEKQFNVNMDGTLNSQFLLNRLDKYFKFEPAIENEFRLIPRVDEESEVLYVEIDSFEEEVATATIETVEDYDDMMASFAEVEELVGMEQTENFY